MNSKILIVDTKEYSGNFERQMCAYVTGQFGECGVGDKIAQSAQKDIVYLKWWSEHIQQVSDDNGCHRPAAIWVTPGWINNGMGKHYPDSPEFMETAKQDCLESFTAYKQTELKEVQERLETNNFDASWTKKACEQTIAQINEDISTHNTNWRPYPSYQSVAIFVDKAPPAEVWSEFTQRAEYFCQNFEAIEQAVSKYKFKKDPIPLIGFRQLEPQLKKYKTVKIKK